MSVVGVETWMEGAGWAETFHHIPFSFALIFEIGECIIWSNISN